MINKLLVAALALAGITHAAVTDEFKKTLINRFVPNVVYDSRDVTANGTQIEAEPCEIMVQNADYCILLANFNGGTALSNHGKGGKDILTRLAPAGRMYWTKGSTGYIGNTWACVTTSSGSCGERNTKFTKYLPDPNNCNINPFCNSSAGMSGLPYYQYFDWPGATPAEWKSAYQNYGPSYAPTVYATFFENTTHYVLQYYYFIPVNDFTNDHEGDWENVNLHVLKTDESRIAKIDYLFHHKYLSLEVTGANAAKIDIVAGHPVLYAGGFADYLGMKGAGSHGLFPYPGEYTDIESGCPESVDGKGKILHWNQFTIKYMLADKGSDPFYYPVYWGRSANLGWVDDACAAVTFISKCASAVYQKPPMSRPNSGRWKKTASEITPSIEEVTAYGKTISRTNTVALEKIKQQQAGWMMPIQHLIND
jgi:hypothetical protein